MFKDFIQSIYEKVYIINFEKCSQIPCLTSEELKSLFLNFINPEEWDTISFDSDFMPFQQS
ncbi:DUF3884 family protein [Streptococcus pneumoniae]|uniref:DUF3884 family protein n=2 Tax=Streptococcus pneumoniae TaxID=1313 RepID=A0A121AQI8_STREE|nr:DUF3884 family protein [Streptococcus pneumoniae]EGJ17104.1 hypothetical protein SPAR120_1150 [Streptococcus pneumoniae GA47901]ELU57216.1 hypothetical protein PCS8106_01439 [Streptococcus pneumoniae PCS8106]ELU58663.1 hypothetical protein PCS8203_00310 [Streptococcus pneumoniae PCS8203]MBW8134507.1 DUF3884 family protein [Streptococcus pneumoniae]MDA5267911.1 hypothetical protein [Streptococcus pneumoniae]